MTESTNVKKQNSKKGVIAIIAVIAVIALAVGIWGISAYLTDRQSATNTFTVGRVSIELLEPSWVANNATELTANQELAKDPQIKNNGSNPAYVYLKVEIPKEIIRRNSTIKEELFTVSYNGTTGINTADWDLLNETVGEDSVVRVYYYKTNNGILNAGATTNPLFDTIKLANITDGANLEGQSFNVQVDAYAIQSNNLDMPASANTTKLQAQYAWEKYWAQDEDVNSATVTFLDEDGETVLGTSKVRLGTNASYSGATPSKASTQQYSYTFSGWDDPSKLNNVTENRSVRAVYTSTTNKYVVTFYDENGTTKLGESEVDYGGQASFTGSTPTKEADASYTYEFDNWYTSQEANATVDNLSNVVANRSVYAHYIATAIPVAQGTTIGGRTISQILAEEGYAGLYGTEVKYQNKTFRVFYVEDSSNKFGEGEGTIYLKADKLTSTAIGTYANSTYTANEYNSSKTVIRTVNPEWAQARGSVAESSWQVNEKATAYLCDPTVETWSNYVDQSAEEVNWVIGAPSAEMYMKSYSQYKNNSYDARYTASVNGYQYSLNGSSYANYQSNAIADDNAMYRNSSQAWWLASPSAAGALNVCLVHGDLGRVNGRGVDNSYGVCPLVSLKSGVNLELAD